MQKIGVYLVILVAGALIGVSFSVFLTSNGGFGDQAIVTIQGIEYISVGSVLSFDLANDVPERNPEGVFQVSQGNDVWSGSVLWQYTGSGMVEVVCNGIDEDESFRVAFRENGHSIYSLDRVVSWTEVVRDNSVEMMGYKGNWIADSGKAIICT